MATKLSVISHADKTWSAEGDYAARRNRMICKVSTDDKSEHKAFYERTAKADLYRVSVLTTRKVSSGAKITFGRTYTMKGPIAPGRSEDAAVFVAKSVLPKLVKRGNRHSKPMCTVCLGLIGKSMRVVQMTLDSAFTGDTVDPGCARIWVAFRVCSHECAKKATAVLE